MVRNTAREIAIHLSYELNFTDLPVEELLRNRYSRFRKIGADVYDKNRAHVHPSVRRTGTTWGSDTLGEEADGVMPACA